jgi:hypothetical protein
MRHATAASVRIVPPAALSPADWDDVWELTCRFYQADRDYVEAKLRGQQQLALFRSRADARLVGMAAIQVDAFTFQGRRVLTIFTSHGILDERYRGQNLMQRAGVITSLRCWLRYGLHRKYWVYDTFSYKSYWLLPRNLREFWPRRDQPTPPWEAALMEHYGQWKYGDAWRGGVIEGSPHKRLLPQTARLTPELLRDPDLAFFSTANPRHEEGDMLLCLVPLTFANWWGIVSNAMKRALRKRRPRVEPPLERPEVNG